MKNKFYEAFLSIGINQRKPVRAGFEYSVLANRGSEYMHRFIAYLLGGTLRLHRFVRGDDDRAPHDHPWWFITFPFTSYTEQYWEQAWCLDAVTSLPVGEPYWRVRTRIVRAWRFHFRSAKFRHFVIGRADGQDKPFWTLVISGFSTNKWGFWPTPDKFIYWRDWK